VSIFLAIVFYICFAILVIGTLYRIIRWAGVPVPLKIPTTGSGYLDNPKSTTAVVLRMATEVLVFRSLFRNTKYDLVNYVAKSNRFLWLGAILFHWSMLIILLRHLRFFTEPVPGVISLMNELDRIPTFIPDLTITGLLILVALTYLLVRRFIFPEMRFISIFSDYFVLILLILIALTGIIMKFYLRIDVTDVKEVMLSFVAFKPVTKELHWLFAVHFLLVCLLFAYFPFSKLVHAPGIFFSPTRNQKNDARMRRYVNPWDYPAKVQTWEEYKERFGADIKES